MVAAIVRRLTSGLLPPVVLFMLLLLSLYLLSYATEQSSDRAAQLDDLYGWMLLVNVVGLVGLVILVGINLMRLVRQYRDAEPGSRLTVRMVLLFVLLSVLPLGVVFYFSMQFLLSGIDSWFNVEVEKALQDALALSQTSLDLRKRELLKRTIDLSNELRGASEDSLALNLSDLRSTHDAVELALIGQNSRILAFSSADPTQIVPNRPSDDVMMQLRQGNTYVELEPIRDSGIHVRVAIPVPREGGEGEARYMQALYPIHTRLNPLADSVQSSYAQYKKIAVQREPLKKSFSLTLSMVVLLSMLFAVWAAFFFSRRLVAPITDLVEGTRAVAEGNYDKRLPVTTRDELGFLVRSFNDMTRRISRASAEAMHSQRQVEEQHAYLEAVLAHLSSGVITLDRELVLQTVNAAASHILDADLQQYVGTPMADIVKAHTHLQRFVEVLMPHFDVENQGWQEEIVLLGPAGRQVLICRGTTLMTDQVGRGDYVIVFDDVTALIQAQRNAAWGEVARRLAHEIKNPLTPIQLSAERLRHKYLRSMSMEEGELLDRSTNTIVQQVESMKEMVNAFAEYARAPRMEFSTVDLNQLIRDVVELYTGTNSGVDIRLQLDDNGPLIEADSGGLRQLLHNLIKNAQESTAQAVARIDISTHCMNEAGCRYAELRVRDYGEGFADEQQGDYFEPYVTTKPKGTGLGLAIVKKIVEEHGGVIRAENIGADQAGGAQVIVWLPVLMENRRNLGAQQTRNVLVERRIKR